MTKKYFDAVLFLEAKLDRFDRISFFINTLVEFELLHRSELKGIDIELFESHGSKMFKDIDNYMVDYKKLHKKADYRKTLSKIATSLAHNEPSICNHIVGNTRFMVFSDSFGVFEADTMEVFGIIKGGETGLEYETCHADAKTSINDVKMFLKDKDLMSDIYDYLKSEYENAEKGMLS